MPQDVLLTIAEKETAKKAWEAFKTMSVGAERVKEAKVQTLKGQFESLTTKETDNIDDFCMKLSGIATNIRVLGEEIEESSIVRKIRRAVPDKFLQIASNIEQFGDKKTMTVEDLVGHLKAQEERIKGRSNSADRQQLLLVSQNQRTKGNYFRDKSKIRCYNCNTLRHYASECSKSRREREKRQEVNKAVVEDDEPTLL